MTAAAQRTVLHHLRKIIVAQDAEGRTDDELLQAFAERQDGAVFALLLLTLGFVAKLAVAPLVLLFLLLAARRSVLRGTAMAAAAAGVVVGLFAPTWSGAATLTGPGLAASTAV